MKRLQTPLLCLMLTAAACSLRAADYTTLLTPARGFTEVTSTADIMASDQYCYILTAAENTQLIVGVGRYEAKPDWASDDTKALRYKVATDDLVADLSNFFTIETSGQYIGLRNVVYNTSLFQTHDNAGYMYVLTYTEPTMSDWCALTPTWHDGYWLFESGKYPIASANWACGYLGPWNKTVAEGEPIALNRRNTNDDLAGHYRLFRISRDDLYALYTQRLATASPTNMLDMTWKVVNPSFETGDETGWTLNGKDPNGNDEFKTRDYGMTGKDGNYLMNVYQWWGASLSVSQTVSNLPSGIYELSGVVATWTGRNLTFAANDVSTTIDGAGDATGIPATVTVSVGTSRQLNINVGSTGQWWVEGHEGETQTFFKLDDVQLKCKGVYLDGVAFPLPSTDAPTPLTPDVWYYYDVDYPTDYWLIGNIEAVQCATDGECLLSDVSTTGVSRSMTLRRGRLYVKATKQGATLQIIPNRTVNTGTLTAAALNVDGLPNSVLNIELNADGPGADGTKKISQYLASKGYDIVGCSEDFNYNGSLMESLTDNYSCGTVRATLSTSGLELSMLLNGFQFDTDGLNLLWKNSKVAATNESWTGWNSMTKTDGNQYVKKGYRHYDMTIDGGVLVDVFILHMDAGDTNATASRESQWQQLAAAVNASDPARPKLIIGDTNSRWTREDITANFMTRLSDQLIASDVWVELYRNGIYPTTDMADITDQSDPANFTNYEVVDKIIYINPVAANTVQLVPRSFRIEQDYTYGNVDGTDNTTALGDHRPVVVEFTYFYPGDVVNPVLTLDANADNQERIDMYSDVTADVTIDDRTLYKDGSWNTLCLPFDLQIAGSILDGDGVVVKTLESASFGDATLTLNFTSTTLASLEAGKPYLIKWNPTGTDIVSPMFAGVTVAAAASADTECGAVTFKGLYAPLAITGEDRTMLYLGDAGSVYWPNAAMSISAFHAYFVLNDGITAGDPSSLVSIRTVNLGETTGINQVQSDNKGDTSTSQSSVYNLQGQRMNGLQKGLNIVDGQKIMIRK